MPLHPAIVHFPIVLCIVLVVLEFCSDVSIKTKIFLASFLAVALVAAFFTGVSESNQLKELPLHVEKFVATHYVQGRVALILGILLPLLLIIIEKLPEYRNLCTKIYRFTLCLILVVVASGGYIGGRLVYEFGLGVKPLESAPSGL